MRGYQRRSGLSYWIGVALAGLLGIQIVGTLSQQATLPWWGFVASPDGLVRRVAPESPAAAAGLTKGDRIVRFDGRVWALSELVRPDPTGRVAAELRTAAGESRSLTLTAARAPQTELVRQWLKGGIALAFVLTGLVVFLARSDTVATLFFFVCLLFGRLLVPPALAASEATMLINKAIVDVASLVLPAVVLHFFLLFPARARFLRRNARLAWLLYVPAILAMPLAVKFDLDLVSTGIIGDGARALQSFMAMLFVVMIVWGIIAFLRGVRNVASPVLRRSLRWVLPGTALGILPPLLLSALYNLAPSLEIPGDRFAFASLVLVPLSFGHAIIRYGLLDLEIVVRRSVVFATVTAVLVTVYWVVADSMTAWIGRSDADRTVVSLAVVFAVALLFVPVRDRLQAWIERSFYRGRHFDYRTTVREFSNRFATLLERDELVRLLVDEIPGVLGTERAALFLRTSRDEALRISGTRGLGANEIPLPLFVPSDELKRWWAEFEGPVPIGSARRTPERLARVPAAERELLESLDARVLVFLPREKSLEGLLVLGPKADGERYRSEDLELLAPLGDQAATSLSSSRLHEEALERRRLEEELAVAKKIQASLLPAEIPAPPGLDLAAMTRPCQHVGGDFFDFLDFGADGLGLAVADVSGKGVPAALILSSLQATLRAEASASTPPEPIVRRVNERLCLDVESGNFASMLYGHLDLNRQTFRYVNAGHPAGLIVRRDGHVERLDEGGLLLGVAGEAEYVGADHSLAAGDLLVLYSDGVTDVLNADDEEFGPERLERLLPRLAHLPSRAVIDHIVRAVESFVGGSLPDDITLLVARFRSPEESSSPA